MKTGYLYIAIAVVMFSSFEVVLKFIAGELNSVQLTFARFVIGFLFLLPLALHTLRKRKKRLDTKTLAYFALLGFTGISLEHDNSPSSCRVYQFLGHCGPLQL